MCGQRWEDASGNQHGRIAEMQFILLEIFPASVSHLRC